MKIAYDKIADAEVVYGKARPCREDMFTHRAYFRTLGLERFLLRLDNSDFWHWDDEFNACFTKGLFFF